MNKMFSSTFQEYKADPPQPIIKKVEIKKCSTCHEDIINEKPIGLRDGSGRVFHSGKCLYSAPPRKMCEICHFPMRFYKDNEKYHDEKYHEKCKNLNINVK